MPTNQLIKKAKQRKLLHTTLNTSDRFIGNDSRRSGCSMKILASCSLEDLLISYSAAWTWPGMLRGFFVRGRRAWQSLLDTATIATFAGCTLRRCPDCRNVRPLFRPQRFVVADSSCELTGPLHRPAANDCR